MSRPRTISSNDILKAAYDLIMEQGPSGLTFNRLAAKVGLVPGALVRRFTNKRNLLAEIDRYALAQSTAALQAIMEKHDSPIDAIIAGLVNELSFATSMDKFINGQAFLLTDLADPALYANYHVSFHQRQKTIAELLGKAQQRGELTQDVQCTELAQLLQMVQQGAGHIWAMTQEEPIDQLIERSVWSVLRPYLTDKHKERQ